MSARIAAIVLVLCSLISTPAAAQLSDESWRDYGIADAAVTTGFAALAITTELIGGPKTPRWDREILLDLPLRRVVGSRRTAGEHRAAIVSDIAVGMLMAAPFVDAGVAGYAVHGDGKLATNFSLFALEGFALTMGTTNLIKVLVGRARPAVAVCYEARRSDPLTPCPVRPNVSFFSGHSSVAFTGAGLVCTFGRVTPLHGDGFVGQIPCASAMSVAAATAVLRIVANKHHFSDVLVGTAVGLLSGLGWTSWRLQ